MRALSGKASLALSLARVTEPLCFPDRAVAAPFDITPTSAQEGWPAPRSFVPLPACHLAASAMVGALSASFPPLVPQKQALRGTTFLVAVQRNKTLTKFLALAWQA